MRGLMTRVMSTSLCLAVLGAAAAFPSRAQDAPPAPPATPAPQPAPAPAPPARAAGGRMLILRKSTTSYLGIGVAEIDAERAKALHLKEVRGVEVKSVDPDSPAAKAGLQVSDVVLEYNGERIEGTEQFVRLVHETPADRQVKLVVWRNGANKTLTATIGHRLEHFTLRGDDGGDFTIEIPPVPPMPNMPNMPNMPEIPKMPEIPEIPAMPEMGYLRNGLLGIEGESLGSQLATFFGVQEGVLVRAVVQGSPAEKAGMKAGDVIVKIDGETVSNTREIRSLMRGARRKDTVPVVIVRDKKQMTLNVAVGYGYPR